LKETYTVLQNEDAKKRKNKARRRRRREALKRQKEEAQERQGLEQEEWKSVARAVDIIFFRIYVGFMLISHLAFLGCICSSYRYSWVNEDDADSIANLSIYG